MGRSRCPLPSLAVEHCQTLQAGNRYFGVEVSANVVIEETFQGHGLPALEFGRLLRTTAGQVSRLVGPDAIVCRESILQFRKAQIVN